MLPIHLYSMYSADIKDVAINNTNFRKVLQTGQHSQLVVMSLLPGEDIGAETHPHVDQFFYFVDGTCEATVDGVTQTVTNNQVVYVSAGSLHNFKNSAATPLKLFTIYSPPQHPDGTIHITKADAQKAERDEK